MNDKGTHKKDLETPGLYYLFDYFLINVLLFFFLITKCECNSLVPVH
jgi:hypothetical protein